MVVAGEGVMPTYTGSDACRPGQGSAATKADVERAYLGPSEVGPSEVPAEQRLLLALLECVDAEVKCKVGDLVMLGHPFQYEVGGLLLQRSLRARDQLRAALDGLMLVRKG